VLTHAGGVVSRVRDGVAELLLITARRHPDSWVLPKGHVEAGEAPEQTAVREVAEEAGVVAEVVRFLIDVDLPATRSRERRRVRFYLMRAVRQDDSCAREGRRARWLPLEQALAEASHDWVRRALRTAAAELVTPAG
jgi:8-oxo-dGTP pyrophosphatase MutT (NUDIX family)